MDLKKLKFAKIQLWTLIPIERRMELIRTEELNIIASGSKEVVNNMLLVDGVLPADLDHVDIKVLEDEVIANQMKDTQKNVVAKKIKKRRKIVKQQEQKKNEETKKKTTKYTS